MFPEGVKMIGNYIYAVYCLTIVVHFLVGIINSRKRQRDIILFLITILLLVGIAVEREYYRIFSTNVVMFILVSIFGLADYVLVDALNSKGR